MTLSPLALMSSNWWEDWKWTWTSILELNPAFPLRQKRSLLLPLLCLYWTMVMLCYMHESSQSLHALDTVYHLKTLTHHYELYAQVGWSALYIRWLKHWHVLFINLSSWVYFPHIFILTSVKKSVCIYSLRSQGFFLLSVPVVRTELGEKSFKFAPPFAWNNLQIKLLLRELVSLDVFKVILNNLEMETLSCRCFD